MIGARPPTPRPPGPVPFKRSKQVVVASTIRQALERNYISIRTRALGPRRRVWRMPRPHARARQSKEDAFLASTPPPASREKDRVGCKRGV